MKKNKCIGYLPFGEWAHIAVYEDSPERDKNDPALIPADIYEAEEDIL